jgi:NitT/TauT family transport system substrate-binding protein
MSKHRMKHVAIVTSVILTLSFTSARAAEKVRMLLDWAFQGPQSVFVNALDKGYFAAEGLDVSIDRGFGSSDAVSKLASGSYDIAFGDINSMMEFNTKNTDKTQLIGIFMMYDRAPLAIVTLDESIVNPKDLEGKKLVTSPGAADFRLFPLFAQLAGIDRSKISFVNVQPQLREPMLLRGEAQASTAFYFTSYMSFKALGIDMNKLKAFMYADYGIKIYGNSLMTSVDYANSKPDTLTKFNRAIARSVKDAIASPESAIASIKKRDATIIEAVETERLRLVNKVSILTPFVLENGFGTIDKTRMEQAIEQVATALEMPRKPKVDEVFTDRFLPPREQRLVN